jgi:hypothetical protein
MKPPWRRWRAKALRRLPRRFAAGRGASSTVTLIPGVFELSMEPDVVIAVLNSLKNLILFILILGLRGREAGVDILRGLDMLCVLPRGHARNVCLLERTILVQGSADEVGAIREVRSVRADLDRARSTTALRSRVRLS